MVTQLQQYYVQEERSNDIAQLRDLFFQAVLDPEAGAPNKNERERIERVAIQIGIDDVEALSEKINELAGRPSKEVS